MASALQPVGDRGVERRGVGRPRAAAPRRSPPRSPARPPRRSCAALSRISPIRFSDSAAFTAISASALASSVGELLVDLRLGLGGDPVRLVAGLRERGVVGGLRLLGPPLQERRLLDVVRDRVVALGHHRADPRQRDPGSGSSRARPAPPPARRSGWGRSPSRAAACRLSACSRFASPSVSAVCSPSAAPASAGVLRLGLRDHDHGVVGRHLSLRPQRAEPARAAARLGVAVRPRTSGAARPGTRRCRAPRRRRCR